MKIDLHDLLLSPTIETVTIGTARADVKKHFGVPSRAYNRKGRPSWTIDDAWIWDYDTVLEVRFDQAGAVENIQIRFNSAFADSNTIQFEGDFPKRQTTVTEFRQFLDAHRIEYVQTEQGIGFMIPSSNIVIAFEDTFGEEDVPHFMHSISIKA